MELISIIKKNSETWSGLCALIKDDDLLLRKTREIYHRNTTLQNTVNGHYQLISEKSMFKNFLETKDRNEVISQMHKEIRYKIKIKIARHFVSKKDLMD